ncbi:MAG: 50S ribosomal protein L3 [Candidatus Paceibacterota bacterium]|jgi:large subunit ribosomal protein L3
MSFILGKKLQMSQIFKDTEAIPVTLIQAGPVVVTQIKNKEKDGYEAVQIGFDATKKKLTKSIEGHLKKIKELNPDAKTNFRFLKEFKTDISNLKIGDTLTVSQFKDGDKVIVIGLSKGRGFQGVVKRHGFHGGPKTHGQKNRLRAPGSIGTTALQRVRLGRRMAGRMGQEKNVVKNLEVVGVDLEKNILMIRGAVPGTKGALVEITNS